MKKRGTQPATDWDGLKLDYGRLRPDRLSFNVDCLLVSFTPTATFLDLTLTIPAPNSRHHQAIRLVESDL